MNTSTNYYLDYVTSDGKSYSTHITATSVEELEAKIAGGRLVISKLVFTSESESTIEKEIPSSCEKL